MTVLLPGRVESVAVLGLHYNGMHDSSVALVGPSGAVEFALSEERVSRVKKDGRFPRSSLRHVDMDRVDVVAVPYLREALSPGLRPSPTFHGELLSIRNIITAFPQRWHQAIAEVDRPAYYYDHHLSHASAGYYLSGFREALVFTSDAGAPNCPWSTCFFLATPDGISQVDGASIEHYWPLCRIYSDVTALLGFRPLHHEGKVTGLAARGRSRPECQAALWSWYAQVSAREVSGARPILYDWSNLFCEDPPDLRVDQEYCQAMRAELADFTDLELARAAQDILEEKSIGLLSEVLARTPSLPLVLSGGMFANVALNMKLQELSGREVFVCPPMGDEGLSIGAALLAHRELAGRIPTAATVPNLYLGPLPSKRPATKLASLGLSFERLGDAGTTVGRLISRGAIIAVVRGRAEFGPRALGNRSVLCPADKLDYHSMLNRKLHRDEFMPFAPCFNAAQAARLLNRSQVTDIEKAARFMTISLRASPLLSAICPAVVHVDGTIRAQLVDDLSAPFLARVLQEYERITGLPALINTSFNIHGEPIVNSTRDAIRAFVAAELDYMLIDDCLITYAENSRRWDLALRLLAKDDHGDMNGEEDDERPVAAS